jgi:hydrogenase nickel incorporation protein HypB
MCTVCGCGSGETRIEDGVKHAHGREHGHEHKAMPNHSHHHHYGTGDAGASVPGMSQSRLIQLEQDILSKNNSYADANRRYFAEHGIFALNLVSSPGSGKTSLLVETLKRLGKTRSCYVIEGDQQTTNDADRIRATGAPPSRSTPARAAISTATWSVTRWSWLALERRRGVFIENVGNLVCPAAFDLGEAHKVAILSVTEGEDKPLKYPDMFAAADVMVW